MSENLIGAGAVNAAEIAGSVTNMDMSLIGLITRADIVVQLVMLMLVICSVWCWAIVFEKWVKYSSIKEKCENFEKKFWSGQVLDQLYEKLKGRANNPHAVVFCSAMAEWNKSDLKLASSDHSIKSGVKERIVESMRVAINREVARLGTSLSILATIGSYSPFIGLFGTVWGIMHSFQSIAASKNTSLAVVAPGIAEALLATAIGLLAAIPAVVFYNVLNAKLSEISDNVEDFSIELSTLLSRELDGRR